MVRDRCRPAAPQVHGCGSCCVTCTGDMSPSALCKPGSTFSLLWDHPSLVCRATLWHPCKAFALLRKSQAPALRRFCENMPPELMEELLPKLFATVKLRRFSKVLAPLLNDLEVQSSLIAVARQLDASLIAEIINGVPPGKLDIVLRAPESALVQLISTIRRGRAGAVLIPVLNEDDSVLEGTLLPLLNKVTEPERIAAIANHIDPEVLLLMLRHIEASKLAELINALSPQDFNEDGSVILLLKELADNMSVLREKVVPLLTNCESVKLAQLVQGVKAAQLLEVLQRVDVEGVLRLLEHTNAELVVRLFNGPLEATVSGMAGSLADVMKLPVAASTVSKVTDALNEVLAVAEMMQQDYEGAEDYIVEQALSLDRIRQDVVAAGKVHRGAGAGDEYHFGDFTRGLIARGLEHAGRHMSPPEPQGESHAGVRGSFFKAKDVLHSKLKVLTEYESLEEEDDPHMACEDDTHHRKDPQMRFVGALGFKKDKLERLTGAIGRGKQLLNAGIEESSAQLGALSCSKVHRAASEENEERFFDC